MDKNASDSAKAKSTISANDTNITNRSRRSEQNAISGSGSGSAKDLTKEVARARKLLAKAGVERAWKVASKNIQKDKEDKPMLNRATVVNMLKNLKVVEPDEFLSRQFGTAGNIEPKEFMAWVFEAELQMSKIDMQHVEEVIRS